MDDGLAILGCGKIGEILAAGLVASAWRRPDQIIVTARRSGRAEELAARHGLHATTSNLEAGFRYGVPTVGTSAHAFTLVHDSEADGFAACEGV